MYDDGKRSILGSIFYAVLWILGLLLLIFLVYKVGFASLFGSKAADDGDKMDEKEIITEIDEEIAASIKAEEDQSAQEAEEELPEEAPEETIEEETPQDAVVADANSEQINSILGQLSTEAKVAQLFFITPEQLTGVNSATAFGDMSVTAFTDHPVGGIIYSKNNFTDPAQTAEMLSKANSCSTEVTSLPLFIGIDEEGGRILRLADVPAFNIEKTPSMAELSGEGVEDAVYHAADQIGAYLKEYGFNVDFAPVADVLIEPSNAVIGDRSFGNDPDLVSKLSSDYMRGLHNNHILSCYKHYPGHGATAADSHDSEAVSERTMDEIRAAELIPFTLGISAGTDFVMTGHISFPNIPETEGLPATLSSYMITDVLRNELGYDGIVITDALNMGAIRNSYASADASVAAFLAGCDMLLMPEDFEASYNAILEKVNSGEISEDRLNESVYRIIRSKLSLG